MNLEVNQLAVEVTASPRIATAGDLEVTVTFRNSGNSPIRLNTLFLQSATLVLRIRRLDETPVQPGPPPVPPLDDGQVGRKVLAPGESTRLVYRGQAYLGGKPLARGTYQVRFRHESPDSGHGDWTGTIESEWMSFEVTDGVSPDGR